MNKLEKVILKKDFEIDKGQNPSGLNMYFNYLSIGFKEVSSYNICSCVMNRIVIECFYDYSSESFLPDNKKCVGQLKHENDSIRNNIEVEVNQEKFSESIRISIRNIDDSLIEHLEIVPF